MTPTASPALRTTLVTTLATRLPGPRVGATRREGSKRVGRLVVCFRLDRGDGAAPRVAVVASRAVGGAVQRNRAKRYLREAARRVELPAGCDLVLHARERTAHAGTVAVAEELARLLEATS